MLLQGESFSLPLPQKGKKKALTLHFKVLINEPHSVSADSERPASTKGMSRAIDQLQV